MMARETVTETKWLRFVREDTPKRKTPIVWVYNHADEYLGSIRWYSQWRQFCLVVEHDSPYEAKFVYAKSCLDDITAMIATLAEERRMQEPCPECGRDLHGFKHARGICRYCAGEAE